MYKTGVYFGRFLPPHRGHLYQMIEASTKCHHLVVVISDNANQTREICKEAGIPEISYRLRKQWISQQLQDMDHISVRVLDETDIPVYPAGWDLWSKRMREVVPEPIDAFFVGDMEYGDTLATYFPEATVELFDPARTRYPISATDIRSNILLRKEDVSDEEVIQFGFAPNQHAPVPDHQVVVLASDIDAFLAGGFLEVCQFDRKESKKHRKPRDVVAYARSKLGMGGYNIIYNNCEHFANECVSGEHISHQAENVRALFRKMPIVDVYLAALPEREMDGLLTCPVRQAHIAQISNVQTKREKYYVWKLLEYGLDRSLGLKIKNMTFTKAENGQFLNDQVCFSLSHSKGALAVAVSRAPVGVDIECMDLPRHPDLPRRIMTDGEYAAFEQLSQVDQHSYLLRLWTAKEALFKASGGDRFQPQAQNTQGASFRSFQKNVGGSLFALSVATDTPEKIRIFEDVKL